MGLDAFSLKGKVIVITGASSGIGKACAIRCAEAGASVILIARNRDRLDATASLLPNGTLYKIIEADLSTGILPEGALKEALSGLGSINGLIHAAGISNTLPLRLIDADKLNHFYQTNVTGAILLTRLISKPANAHKDGCSIVWLSSVMGLVGEVGKTLYSLTKGALIAGAKSLALELASKKIRVNCISPGVVVTPMTESAVYSQTPEAKERITQLHPLGLGNTDDIAYASIYLLSDASRWVTGTNLVIDGGYTAR
jgi:NAD(P)-dependent dehydrogenase (short-subunit alcohol dehydrogenase family)